jgi:hypothetical protein
MSDTHGVDMQPSISLTTPVAPLDWEVADDYTLVDFPDEHVPQRPRRTLIVRRGLGQLRRYTICPHARTRVALIVSSRGEPKTLARGLAQGPVASDVSAMAARARAAAERREALARQLADEHSIFLDLANTVASSSRRNMRRYTPEEVEAARAFIKKWGMLTVTSPDRSLSSTVEAFLSRAGSMREALMDAEHNGWRQRLDKMPGLRGVALEKGLTLQPKTLFEYCWLELFAAFKWKFQFYKCGNEQCSKYGLLREPVGIEESRDGLRLRWRSGPDREFCDDACRKKANRARAARARAA